jgi:hypothetical protein
MMIRIGERLEIEPPSLPIVHRAIKAQAVSNV